MKSWKEQSEMERNLNSSNEGKHLNVQSETTYTLPDKCIYMHLPPPPLPVSGVFSPLHLFTAYCLFAYPASASINL